MELQIEEPIESVGPEPIDEDFIVKSMVEPESLTIEEDHFKSSIREVTPISDNSIPHSSNMGRLRHLEDLPPLKSDMAPEYMSDETNDRQSIVAV